VRVLKYPHSPTESSDSTFTKNQFTKNKDDKSLCSSNEGNKYPELQKSAKRGNEFSIRERTPSEEIWRRATTEVRNLVAISTWKLYYGHSLNSLPFSQSTASASEPGSSNSVDIDVGRDVKRTITILYDEYCFDRDKPIALEYKFTGDPREQREVEHSEMRDARMTYGVLNCSGQRFLPGFPFRPKEYREEEACVAPSCADKGPRSKIIPPTKVFPVTFCPPHDLELILPNLIEHLSFDLGFTVMEADGVAYVASVMRNSPAELAGVRALDTIIFAFEHSLSSSFHNNKLSPSDKPSSATISVISPVEPILAVYHPTERESSLAAEYALDCAKKGSCTSFDNFCDLFVFDVTKPMYAHKPFVFEGRDEPVLYPVTIVFERGGGPGQVFNINLDGVKKTVDEALNNNINPFFKYAFNCLDASHGRDKRRW